MAVFISQEFLLLVRNKKLASCSFQYGYIVTFLSKLFIFLLLSSNFFSFKIHFFFFYSSVPSLVKRIFFHDNK